MKLANAIRDFALALPFAIMLVAAHLPAEPVAEEFNVVLVKVQP